jgi:hypothetical protein
MIKFFDIFKQDKDKFQENINDFKNIIKNTNFINGKQVLEFEKILQNFALLNMLSAVIVVLMHYFYR